MPRRPETTAKLEWFGNREYLLDRSVSGRVLDLDTGRVWLVFPNPVQFLEVTNDELAFIGLKPEEICESSGRSELDCHARAGPTTLTRFGDHYLVCGARLTGHDLKKLDKIHEYPIISLSGRNDGLPLHRFFGTGDKADWYTLEIFTLDATRDVIALSRKNQTL